MTAELYVTNVSLPMSSVDKLVRSSYQDKRDTGSASLLTATLLRTFNASCTKSMIILPVLRLHSHLLFLAFTLLLLLGLCRKKKYSLPHVRSADSLLFCSSPTWQMSQNSEAAFKYMIRKLPKSGQTHVEQLSLPGQTFGNGTKLGTFQAESILN